MDKSATALPLWSRPERLDNAETVTSPALVNTGNNLLLVFVGKNSENLWYCQSDQSGLVWDTPPKRITDQRTRQSPALASMGDSRAKLVYTGAKSTNIWEADFDGKNWSGSSQIKDRNTDSAPVIAFRGDTLFLAHRGTFQSSTLYWAYKEAKTWSLRQKIGSVVLRANAADFGIAEFQNSVYIAYLDRQDGLSYIRLAPDQDWSFPQKIPFNNPGGSPPALGVSPDGKYLLFVFTERFERQLLQIAFDGENWSDVGVISDHLSRRPPSLASLNGRFHMVHRGQSSSQIWISHAL